MSRTYKATGINLKGMPLGEADRLVTILTPEFGLIRAVAPGARKHKSKLRGRSELFVVNQLLIAKGRSLDKITQAETIESYPGLSRDLGKLAASQYLAEFVLCLALSEQPQPELYELLNEHLRRLQQLSNNQGIFPHLAQAVFHLLALAGIGPQVHTCCLTQQSLTANFTDPHWRVGFSFDAGGLVSLSAKGLVMGQVITKKAMMAATDTNKPSPTKVNTKLGAVELTLVQQLGAKSLPQPSQILPKEFLSSSLDVAWVRVERILRDYALYHFGRSIRSAALVDALCPLEF
ncbi:MAG: DNA repair protein RecO [Xenococcaceae cyanobacterium]